MGGSSGNVTPEALFEGRERRTMRDLGANVSAVVEALIRADVNAKFYNVEYLRRLLAMPNVDIHTAVALLGGNQDLETRLSVPAVLLTDTDALEISEATVETSFSVHASESEETHVGASTEVSASGGFFGFSVGLSARASVDNTRKRAGDYTSSANVKVTMKQGGTPEGVSKVLDIMNRTVEMGGELNEKIIEQQKARESAEIEQNVDEYAQGKGLPEGARDNSPTSGASGSEESGGGSGSGGGRRRSSGSGSSSS